VNAYLCALVGSTSASPFVTVALFAGGICGALLRVVLERVARIGSLWGRWARELGLAVTFSAALGLAFAVSLSTASSWSPSGMGGALTAYAGASAAIAFSRARERGTSAIRSAVWHLLADLLVSTAGFAAIVLTVRLWHSN